MIKQALIYTFVDSMFFHEYWHCHQLSERSFFVSGRQFHICARCTGLFVGYVVSPILIPWRYYSLYLFPIAALCMLIDGITQMLNWRTSNNILRLLTGFSFGFTFLSFLIYIIGGIVFGCQV